MSKRRRTHKLKISHWDENRILLLEELLFYSLEDAIDACRHSIHEGKHKKIYDENDELVHSEGPKEHDHHKDHHHGHQHKHKHHDDDDTYA